MESELSDLAVSFFMGNTFPGSHTKVFSTSVLWDIINWRSQRSSLVLLHANCVLRFWQPRILPSPTIYCYLYCDLKEKPKFRVAKKKKKSLSLLRVNFSICIFLLSSLLNCIKAPPVFCQSSSYLETRMFCNVTSPSWTGEGFDVASAGKAVSFPAWVLPASEGTLPVSSVMHSLYIGCFSASGPSPPLSLSFSLFL